MLSLLRIACLIAMIAAGLSGRSDAKPYQRQDAFKAAILDDSTAPFIVLIEVVDDRTGKSVGGCTSANFLKGAI